MYLAGKNIGLWNSWLCQAEVGGGMINGIVAIGLRRRKSKRVKKVSTPWHLCVLLY